MTIKELATLLRVSQAFAKNLLATYGFTLEDLTDDQLTTLKELVVIMSKYPKLAKKDLGEIVTQHSGSLKLAKKVQKEVQISSKKNIDGDETIEYTIALRGCANYDKYTIALLECLKNFDSI